MCSIEKIKMFEQGAEGNKLRKMLNLDYIEDDTSRVNSESNIVNDISIDARYR